MQTLYWLVRNGTRQTTLDEYACPEATPNGPETSAVRGVSDTMVVNSTARMHERFRQAQCKGGADGSMCPSAGSSTDSLPSTPPCSRASQDSAEQQAGLHPPPQEDESGGPSARAAEPPRCFRNSLGYFRLGRARTTFGRRRRPLCVTAWQCADFGKAGKRIT